MKTIHRGKLGAWLLTAALGVALVCLQSGCAVALLSAGAAAGAGTVAYVNGELKTTEAVPLDKAWNATQGANKELGFTVESQAKDAIGAKLVARTSNGKKVQIKLKKLADNSTELVIRVGTFGDDSLSRLILDKIRHRL